MYTLKKAYVKNEGWEKRDISALRLDVLMSQYKDVYITVHHEEQGTFQVDLGALFLTLSQHDRTYTVGQWLAQQTQLTPDEPLTNLSDAMTLTVTDIWDHAVDVGVGNEGFSLTADIPYDSRTDITIVDKAPNGGLVNRFANGALISVNGQLMQPHRVNDALFLKGAKRWMDTEGGILSLQVWDFTELGPLTHVPITTDNTIAVNTHRDLVKRGKRRFKVHSETDLTNKFPIAVIDGQPQLLNNIVFVYDAHTAVITVDMDRLYLQLVNTPIAYRKGLKETDSRDSAISVDNVDPLAFLTSGYSFITFIDGEDINFFTRPLGRTDIPGCFTYPYPPKGGAIDYRGNVIDYHLHGWDGVTASLNTLTSYNPNYVHEHVPREERHVVSDTQFHSDEIMGGWMVNLYRLKA